MRLLRLTPEASAVSADIRAALISLGRGDSVVGGVALLGVSASSDQPADAPIDAIVALPRGILIIVGVNLANPILHLEAPLRDQWTADGWPLPSKDERPNPAIGAIAAAQACEKRIRELFAQEFTTEDSSPQVEIIVAVGPFIETVEQPQEELNQATVLFPTPLALLTKISHLPERNSLSVITVRQILALFAPQAAEQTDEQLIAEGFAAHHEMPAKPDKQERYRSQRRNAGLPDEGFVLNGLAQPARKKKTGRSIALVACAVLVVAAGISATIVVMNKKDTGGNSPSQASVSTAPSIIPVAKPELELLDNAKDQRCASHAFGEIQMSLQRSSCLEVKRASFKTVLDGHVAAVTVAVVTLPEKKIATELKQLADDPNGGGIVDLAADNHLWPERSIFENAARGDALTDNQVRLVRAAWPDRPSTVDDPALNTLVRSGLTAPLPE